MRAPTLLFTGCLLLMGSLLAGCPESKTPEGTTGGVTPEPTKTPTTPATVSERPPPVPAPTTQTQPAIAGSWSVSVTSEPPGINPDMFDTPEKKAKVFFDHHAVAKGGKVTVKHNTLGTTSEVEADAAASLDTHMTGVDWEAVMKAAQKDGATEGGTVFEFSVTVGQASWKITTTNIEKHPDLMKVVDALKAATGKP